MLSWLFKKRAPASVARTAPPPARQALAVAEASAAAQAEARRNEGLQWQSRLQAAHGDDAALLQLAQTAPTLEIKLAAVEALAGESALKAAEREFRSHDRRVHRVARQRLDAAVAQREGRARAQALIETLAAMNDGRPVPVNLLVALDRDWQALDSACLAPEQPAQFAAGRARLDAAMRALDEQQQAQRRWLVDAKAALSALRAGLAEAEVLGFPEATGAGDAEGAVATDADAEAGLPVAVAASPSPLAALRQAAQTLVDNCPTSTATAALDSELRATLDAVAQAAEQAQTRRILLAAQAAAPVPESPPVVARKVRAALLPLPNAEQLLAVEATLQAAESALAEGRMGALRQQLTALDAALHDLLKTTRELPPGHPLLARRLALHTEAARLQGWQAWGGGQARDSLTDEAEALARLTLTAAEPDAPKLRLQAHGEQILALRLRWKELDRLGAAAPQALWQRFDAALQIAYQPLAARQAAQQATRKENLAAREALLDALEAVGAAPLPPEAGEVADADAAAGAELQADPPSADTSADSSADPTPAHWKEQARALGAFQLAWRQLGPLEHSVPASARAGLQQRLRTSVERIEAPLHQARREAEAVREQFIARAEALVQELARQPQMREAIPRVREIQADWQQHARAVPLARAVEGALWARFKVATDAVYAQREAVSNAFEAGLNANLAAREALLDRLSSALADDLAVAGLERTLAEVERAWREPLDLPRGAAGAIEARFRDARAAAMQRLAEVQRAAWHAQCEALIQRLALCDEREGPAPTDDLSTRWAAYEAAPLPAAWRQALAQRWLRPVAAGAAPLDAAAFDDILLQLEIALDLPAAPEWQAARRQFKLRAMKDALEGRASVASGPVQRAEWLAAAWRQGGTSATQRERLQALVSALQAAGPDRRWAAE